MTEGRDDDARDADLDEELKAHLTMDANARIVAGATPDSAAAAARREFGNLGQIREVTRSMRGDPWWDRWSRQVRQAVRSLLRTPGLALAAVVTLALGIGANTAIFTVINGVLLRPLPYPRPDRLVFISSQFPAMGFDQFAVDAAEYIEFRARNRSFSDVGIYTVNGVNVGAGDHPVRVAAAQASASLFHTLGVSPAIGRVFSSDEEIPNAAPVVILSWELWKSAFGGGPIVGKRVEVDGVSRLVVGILPAGFDVHDNGIRLWAPTQFDVANLQRYRGGHNYQMIGRLRDGVTPVKARADLNNMLAQWIALDGGNPTAANPGVHAPDPVNHRLRFDDLQADMVGSAGRTLWVLQAAVGLVLLIACANLTNLLLMRAESRHRELGIRLALGAGRGHLVRQFLAEGLVLSLSGAALGVILAEIGLHALTRSYAGSIPRVASVSLDLPVLLFTLGLAVATGAIFGLAPLLHIDKDGANNMLRDGGTRATAGIAGRSMQRTLVIAEIAMAVTLVIGAGLLVQSLRNLLRVDSGFDREQLTTFSLSLPQAVYRDSVQRVVFFDRLTSRLSSIPGVKAVAAMDGLPPLRPVNANDTQFENFTPRPGGPMQNVDYWQFVTPSYLSTMRIKVAEGRDFNAADGPASPPVVLVNQTLAKLFYPGQSALGHRVKPGGATGWFTIVGVVKDVKQGGVDSKTGTELYIDYAQSPPMLGFAPTTMNVVIRSSLSTATIAPMIRRIVLELDPSLPVDGLRSMDDVFAASVSRPRFLAVLLGVFALLALTLAAVGTYGVLAYAVTQRRREIGIRMALGAKASEVLKLVLRQGLTLAGAGLLLGLIGSIALSRLIGSLLFGVQATDPVTFATVAGLIAVVALVACALPARRATCVDPVVALRSD